MVMCCYSLVFVYDGENNLSFSDYCQNVKTSWSDQNDRLTIISLSDWQNVNAVIVIQLKLVDLIVSYEVTFYTVFVQGYLLSTINTGYSTVKRIR